MYVVLANFILIELLRDVLKNCVLVVSLLVCYYDVCLVRCYWGSVG